MAETTGIHWADATWNPWYGCKMVSAGCSKCYMFREMRFYGRDPNVVTRAAPGTFNNPRKWAKGGKVKPGARIFTCSWSDWFIDKADDWRAEAWQIVKDTPQYIYMILTKRPEYIAEHLPADWGAGYPNVWLGVTCENQEMANERIPILLEVPAAIRWLSVEPILSQVDLVLEVRGGHGGYSYNTLTGEHWPLTLTPRYGAKIDWVITGGESDPDTKDAPGNPRPCDLDWVRLVRDQCQNAGVAYFHKQHGGTHKIDGAWGGRVLDGRTWDEFPQVVHA